MLRPVNRRSPQPNRQVGAILLGLGLCVLPACSSLDAQIYNLGELHHEDGNVSYTAALMGESEYMLRRAFTVSAPFGTEFDFEDKDPDLVSDPSEACLEVLLELNDYPIGSLRHLALRTEMYIWLATGDPYILARERCVLELGAIGRELGLSGPIDGPALEDQPSVEELSGCIADLISASAPVLGSGKVTSTTTLSESCEAISKLDLGITAGRRVLRTCAVLLDAPGSGVARFEPVRLLTRDVAYRLTAITLETARYDSSPVVRAAAVRAWSEATNNRAGELMAQVMSEPDTQVVHQLLREIEERGLPRPMEDFNQAELTAWNEDWIANLVKLTRDNLEGSLSAAACQALNRVTDAGFESLRSEDWVGWWERRNQALIDEDRVRRAEP